MPDAPHDRRAPHTPRRAPRRMLASGLLAAGLLAGGLGLAACSSESTPAAPVDDPELQKGQEIYATRCAGCHGATGGGGAGVKLAGRMTEVYPDVADQVAVITNGRSSMPAFGGSLPPEDIEAVALYTREVLGSEEG